MTLQIGIPFAQMTNFGFQVSFKQFVLLWYLSLLSIIDKFIGCLVTNYCKIILH
jgi:hypothetical protein